MVKPWAKALVELLPSIPERKGELAEKICEELMAQKLEEGDLFYIIINAPEKFKVKAYNRLLGRRLSTENENHWLSAMVTCNVPEPWRSKALSRLLRRKIPNKKLRYIAGQCWQNKKICIAIWNKILKQNPTKDDLRFEPDDSSVPKEIVEKISKACGQIAFKTS